MYENGIGGILDYKQVVKGYIESAEQGTLKAQYNLGWLYANGQGVTQDSAQAVKWLSKSSDKGHYYAQVSLDPHWDWDPKRNSS